MPKMNNVTDTDIEMLIGSANDVGARAQDFNHRIFSGKVDQLNEPLRKAVEILATSRSLSDLAMRIINKASLKEDAETIRKTYAER